jgi:hypothetical protein
MTVRVLLFVEEMHEDTAGLTYYNTQDPSNPTSNPSNGTK